jgi:hypothetical protein
LLLLLLLLLSGTETQIKLEREALSLISLNLDLSRAARLKQAKLTNPIFFNDESNLKRLLPAATT